MQTTTKSRENQTGERKRESHHPSPVAEHPVRLYGLDAEEETRHSKNERLGSVHPACSFGGRAANQTAARDGRVLRDHLPPNNILSGVIRQIIPSESVRLRDNSLERTDHIETGPVRPGDGSWLCGVRFVHPSSGRGVVILSLIPSWRVQTTLTHHQQSLSCYIVLPQPSLWTVAAILGREEKRQKVQNPTRGLQNHNSRRCIRTCSQIFWLPLTLRPETWPGHKLCMERTAYFPLFSPL